ncbi:hypothetical protein BCR42DRAFT_486482 [Absidia repens]|uniref:BHLH domain-containing protein n=1 Tax=Absidia repens TaxID=90262 RepID=A0A1X2IY14_9FUNG|nr:hypothetical protein BCR42DRAFT_486482 [Absidia repens]
MMDFSSFDLDNTKDQQSIQHPYSNDTENFDQDASDFFAFIDPTNFHSTATGLDQQQQQQQHAPPPMDNQLQSTHDSQSSTHIMSGGSNLQNDTQNPIRNNNSSYPLMSPMQMNVNEYQTPLQQPMVTDYPEDEEFFTPLISPAIPPNYYTNLRSDTNFSPLTSPALGPQQHPSMNHHYHLQQQQQQQQQQHNGYSTTNYFSTGNTSQDGQSSEELQERLAMIERQQQQLRSHMQQSSSSPSSTSSPAIAVTASPLSSSSSPIHKSTSSATSAYGNSLSVNASNPSVTKPKQQTLRHKIAMSSPQFNPIAHSQSPRMHPSNHTHHNHPVAGNSSTIGYQNTHTTISPATPSLLMKLGNGLHQSTNTSNSSNTTSPATLPMKPSHDSIIDSMMSLPDAILPPSNTASKKKPLKKATISSTITSTSTTKRRRISYPRSAFTPPALLPSSSATSSYHHQHQHSDNHDMATFDQGIAALVSPAALRPHIPTTSSSTLMSPNTGGGGGGGLTSSPRALKPLISPSLQPNGKRLSSIDEHEAAAILASKSNYQTLREGRAKSLGIDFNTNIQSGMENRRSAHKAAEQRRRDTLKQNFDALRMELLDALIREDEEDDNKMEEGEEEEEEGDGETGGDKQVLATSRLEREKKVKQMSKVVLLQHSYEYMLRLKSENQTKDAKLDKMTKEIRLLRTQCGMEPITEEERQAEAEEKRMEKEKRLARLKRLEDMVDT